MNDRLTQINELLKAQNPHEAGTNLFVADEIEVTPPEVISEVGEPTQNPLKDIRHIYILRGLLAASLFFLGFMIFQYYRLQGDFSKVRFQAAQTTISQPTPTPTPLATPTPTPVATIIPNQTSSTPQLTIPLPLPTTVTWKSSVLHNKEAHKRSFVLTYETSPSDSGRPDRGTIYTGGVSYTAKIDPSALQPVIVFLQSNGWQPTVTYGTFTLKTTTSDAIKGLSGYVKTEGDYLRYVYIRLANEVEVFHSDLLPIKKLLSY